MDWFHVDWIRFGDAVGFQFVTQQSICNWLIHLVFGTGYLRKRMKFIINVKFIVVCFAESSQCL